MENKFLDSDIVLSLSQSVHKIQVGIFSGYTLVHTYLRRNKYFNKSVYSKESEKSPFSKYYAKIHNTWPHHMPKGRIEQGQHLYSVIIEVGNPDD